MRSLVGLACCVDNEEKEAMGGAEAAEAGQLQGASLALQPLQGSHTGESPARGLHATGGC